MRLSQMTLRDVWHRQGSTFDSSRLCDLLEFECAALINYNQPVWFGCLWSILHFLDSRDVQKHTPFLFRGDGCFLALLWDILLFGLGNSASLANLHRTL
jgi:hypothetical protein